MMRKNKTFTFSTLFLANVDVISLFLVSGMSSAAWNKNFLVTESAVKSEIFGEAKVNTEFCEKKKRVRKKSYHCSSGIFMFEQSDLLR